MDGRDPQAVADDQFAHGLLSFLHLDSRDRQRKRVERVMASLRAGQAEPAAIPLRNAAVLRRRAWTRAYTGLAAAILVVVGIIAITLPTESTAVATLQSAIEALKKPGSRRYEVRVMLPGRTTLESEPVGVVDVKDEQHQLVRARSPRGESLVFGRNPVGQWAITPEGTIDWFPPPRVRPRWLDLGENTVLVGTVDSQLEQLRTDYALRTSAAASLPGTESERLPTLYDRITAERTAAPSASPEPVRIELWIERNTRLVKRMEMHWPVSEGNKRPQPRQGPPPRGPRGEGDGPRPDRPASIDAQDEGPDRGPMDGPDADNARPDGPPPLGEGPRRDRRTPGGRPEFRPGEEPGDHPDRPEGDEGGPPPRGHMPPDDPLGLGPPGRRGDGLGPDRDGPPEGPRGRGMGPQPGDLAGHRPRPRFIDGPPRFDQGRNPPPPRLIVFERVDVAEFESGWFEPSTHQDKVAPAGHEP